LLDKQKLIKNYQLDLNHCTSLTLISSESCNLNCSYCVMANNINKKEHLKEAEKVKQSFIDGTFLLNLKNII
jgi:sulfatase maturation enzyme AslB (radical SAM superfamily)